MNNEKVWNLVTIALQNLTTATVSKSDVTDGNHVLNISKHIFESPFNKEIKKALLQIYGYAGGKGVDDFLAHAKEQISAYAKNNNYADNEHLPERFIRSLMKG